MKLLVIILIVLLTWEYGSPLTLSASSSGISTDDRSAKQRDCAYTFDLTVDMIIESVHDIIIDFPSQYFLLSDTDCEVERAGLDTYTVECGVEEISSDLSAKNRVRVQEPSGELTTIPASEIIQIHVYNLKNPVRTGITGPFSVSVVPNGGTKPIVQNKLFGTLTILAQRYSFSDLVVGVNAELGYSETAFGDQVYFTFSGKTLAKILTSQSLRLYVDMDVYTFDSEGTQSFSATLPNAVIETPSEINVLVDTDYSYLEARWASNLDRLSTFTATFKYFFNPDSPFQTATFKFAIIQDEIVMSYGEVDVPSEVYSDVKKSDFAVDPPTLSYITGLDQTITITLISSAILPQNSIIQIYCSECEFIANACYAISGLSVINTGESIMFHNIAFAEADDSTEENLNYLVIERFDAVPADTTIEIEARIRVVSTTSDIKAHVRSFAGDVTTYREVDIYYDKAYPIADYEGDDYIIDVNGAGQFYYERSNLFGRDTSIPQVFFTKDTLIPDGIELNFYGGSGTPTVTITTTASALLFQDPWDVSTNFKYELTSNPGVEEAFGSPTKLNDYTITGTTASFPDKIIIKSLTLPDTITNASSSKLELISELDLIYASFLLTLTSDTAFSTLPVDDDLLINDPLLEKNTATGLSLRFTDPNGLIFISFPNYNAETEITQDILTQLGLSNTIISGEEIECGIESSVAADVWVGNKCVIKLGVGDSEVASFDKALRIEVLPVCDAFPPLSYVVVSFGVLNQDFEYGQYLIGGVDTVGDDGIRYPQKYFQYYREVVDTASSGAVTLVSYADVDLDAPFSLGSVQFDVLTDGSDATQENLILQLPWIAFDYALQDGADAIACTIDGTDLTQIDGHANAPSKGYSQIILNAFSDDVGIFTTGVTRVLSCDNVLMPSYVAAVGDKDINLFITNDVGGVLYKATPFVEFPWDYRIDTDPTQSILTITPSILFAYQRYCKNTLQLTFGMRNLFNKADRFLKIIFPGTLPLDQDMNYCILETSNGSLEDASKNVCSIFNDGSDSWIEVANFYYYDVGTFDILVYDFYSPATGTYGGVAGDWDIKLYENDSEESGDLITVLDTAESGLTVPSSTAPYGITLQTPSITSTTPKASNDVEFTFQVTTEVPQGTILELIFDSTWQSVNEVHNTGITSSSGTNSFMIASEAFDWSNSQILLTLGEALLASTDYTFILHNIRNPDSTSSGNIEFSLYFSSCLQTGPTSTSFSLSTVSGFTDLTSGAALAAHRNEAAISNYMIIFSVGIDIQASHIIEIEFPNNYAEGIVRDSSPITCSSYELGTNIECTYEELRKIVVQDLEFIEADMVVALLIQNVQNPAYEQLGVFSVGVRDASAVFYAFGEFYGDTIVPAAQALEVVSVVTSDMVSFAHQFVLNFKTQVDVLSNYSIFVQFPSSFELDFVETATLVLVDTASECENYRWYKAGNSIFFSGIWGDCKKSSSELEITLDNIVNPPTANSKAEAPVCVGVIDMNTKTLITVSGEITPLLDQTFITDNTELWSYDQDGSLFVKAYPAMEAPALNIMLSDISGGTSLILEPISSGSTSFYPEQLSYNSGSLGIPLYITADATFQEDECYTIKFKLVGVDHKIPSNIEFCIELNPITIELDSGSVFPQGGYSTPFTATLDYACPREFVFEATYDSTILDIPSNLLVEQQSLENTFIVSSYESAVGSATLTLTIPQRLQHLYQFSGAAVSYDLVFDVVSSDTPLVVSCEFTNIMRSEVEVQVEGSDVGVYYYQVNYSGLRDIKEYETSKQFAIELPYDVSLRNGDWLDYHSNLFGKHKTVEKITNFAIQNLYGGRDYEIALYLVNPAGSLSAVFEETFSTKAVSDGVRVDLEFSDYLLISDGEMEIIKECMASLYYTEAKWISIEAIRSYLPDVDRNEYITIESLFLTNWLEIYILPNGLTEDEALDPSLVSNAIETYQISDCLTSASLPDTLLSATSSIFTESLPSILSAKADVDYTYISIELEVSTANPGEIASIIQSSAGTNGDTESGIVGDGEPTPLQTLLRKNSTNVGAISSWKENITYNETGLETEMVESLKHTFEFGNLEEETEYFIYFTAKSMHSPTQILMEPLYVLTYATLGNASNIYLFCFFVFLWFLVIL